MSDLSVSDEIMNEWRDNRDQGKQLKTAIECDDTLASYASEIDGL